jgi:hypothetical protein
MMLKFWYNMTMLAAESQRAIWLRMMNLVADGTAAARDTEKMVSETVAAAPIATGRALTGRPPTTVATEQITVRTRRTKTGGTRRTKTGRTPSAKSYRKKVPANKRRHSR